MYRVSVKNVPLLAVTVGTFFIYILYNFYLVRKIIEGIFSLKEHVNQLKKYFFIIVNAMNYFAKIFREND